MGRAIALFVCVAMCTAQMQTPSQKEPDLAPLLGRQIPPIDQAPGHRDLVRFRSQLIAAVTRHDLKYLLSVTEPGVNGCGWDGIDGFRIFITDVGGWDGIREALELGGVMSSATLFRSNYVMTTFPSDADMTRYMVVVKPDSPVQERPDAASVVVGRLHYEIVIPIGEGARWQQIEYRPGNVGYIAASDLKSPTGFSVGLELKEGSWRVKWIGSYCD